MSDISDEQKNPTETQNNVKDELSEQDLDNVSGGFTLIEKPQRGAITERKAGDGLLLPAVQAPSIPGSQG